MSYQKSLLRWNPNDSSGIGQKRPRGFFSLESLVYLYCSQILTSHGPDERKRELDSRKRTLDNLCSIMIRRSLSCWPISSKKKEIRVLPWRKSFYKENVGFLEKNFSSPLGLSSGECRRRYPPYYSHRYRCRTVYHRKGCDSGDWLLVTYWSLFTGLLINCMIKTQKVI